MVGVGVGVAGVMGVTMGRGNQECVCGNLWKLPLEFTSLPYTC